jgi:asparagine synthase (glutamine-hydrolysing)
MCGICGQYNFKDAAPVLRRNLERMTESIRHRGPDDEGYFVSGPVGLGFRRLSIIDLQGGHQPMSDQEQTVRVVFNGEIYNYKELRHELQSFGHIFRTASDTEVIVHGYKQWGEDVFNHLNGMFGLAIWDEVNSRLILARDAFGIKLVYYKIKDSRLYFGSEVRAVLAGTNEAAQVDAGALNLFLRYRYTPSPYTVFEGIRKLAPGTMLICENSDYRVKRWYRYKPKPFSPVKSVAQAEDELSELYQHSVRRHLLSDVPVGLLLSGGMDSGLLLALMKMHGSSWPTYTAGYGSSFADDELTDAAETASAFSSPHAMVELERKSFEKALPAIVRCLEEPIASSSIVPMYFVCQRARQDVKVVLMGQGPDELFGGYRRHVGVRYAGLSSAIPKWLRGLAASAINFLPRNETIKRGLCLLSAAERMKRCQQVLSLMPADKLDRLFAEGIVTPQTGDVILDCWHELAELSEETDELGAFQFVELRSTLPDELLMYADKLSMAHGLEVRVPFLDREIVEYVERLPAAFKVRNASGKWLHRRVAKQLLPNKFVQRKKRGFAVNVVDDWFRDSEANKMVEMLLDNQSLMYEYLLPSEVQKLYREHLTGENDNHKILFSLIMLEQWLRSQTNPIASRSLGPSYEVQVQSTTCVNDGVAGVNI